MGRAHSRAWLLLRTLEDAPVAVPRLETVIGSDAERRAAIRTRYSWRRDTADIAAALADDVDIFDNATRNDLHAGPTIQAAEAGKHVLCEKPLGRDEEEAERMLDAVEAAGVVHMCGFNYRFFPAVQLARQMIAAGRIGEIVGFRSRFLLGTAHDPAETSWRLNRETAGSGVVGDLLAHHIDLARFLVGEPTAVSASTRTRHAARAPGDAEVEDAVICNVEFGNGAHGVLEATRLTPGHVLESVIEVDGSEGSLRFDIGRLNELELSSAAGSMSIHVTEPDHPFIRFWWPRGQGLGWADSFVNQMHHFLGAVAGAWDVAPIGATFEDGYQCARVCDAVLRAAETGSRTRIPQPAVERQEKE
jgi:predicted dehydrogenase